MIEPLLKVALLGEKSLLMELGSPFREALRKFLVCYSVQTVDYQMNDTNMRDMQYLRYFMIIQYVLLPCFQQWFKSGDGEKLIGGPAQPSQDNPDNIKTRQQAVETDGIRLAMLVKEELYRPTKYLGRLLLSHIITKFAIHKRVILQVFHSLLKTHAV
ncbi:transformation/transcription domain-associated protein-like isoform X1 [Mercenaria mercenaria]|uniref:transformation/transcription domain-associated protein-like isoform X1 n=1 Tax=Mercenaria mercenaria TaxID=6596 RepID=UPI00234FA091|nr:transformation/transcription domain-associated protein-like isoform X1 [Mercenaria mercenaria]XP_053398026.1 transformation/transcription domain-associated protein-like isoform X1 [Mercenaria mercenaria]XP_053398027.1 transformation/transcription domain-associated protein-like isoform X1 [Mercenaria mercenaria]